MQTLPELYLSAKDALNLYKVQLNKYIAILKQVTDADVNYDSVVAQITRKYEATATSKAALKDIVSGSDEVLEASKILLQKKANKEAISETMKYLDMVYSLDKKMLDVINKENQLLGGN